MPSATRSARGAAVVAFFLAAAAGLVALVLVAAADERPLAFTLGVAPTQVSAELRPGQAACQEPVFVSAEFSRVRFQVGTYGRRGEPLEVGIWSLGSGRRLAGGRLASGYADVSQPSVPVGRVAGKDAVKVCIRNVGERRVALYGGAAGAAPESDARIDGNDAGADLTLVFERAGPRSLLATVPDMFRRASVFRPGWVGDWTFWLLLALLIAAVPALLALALARSADRGD